MPDFPPYPSGLRLAGRRVVVVGGGHVAQRRVPALIAVGADVVVVAPRGDAGRRGAEGGDHAGTCASSSESDLDDAWYAIAATDDPADQRGASPRPPRSAGSSASAATTRRDATAWTPAVGRHGGVTVAVLGNREPRKSAAVRDEIMHALRDGVDHAHDAETARLVSCSWAAARATRRWSPSPPATRSHRPTSSSRTGSRRASSSPSCSPDVELIDVAKLPRGRSAAQEFINKVIVEKALEGKRVVRFKGGDNFVFGRGYEEVIACQAAGVPVTVVPGLSSVDLRARPGRHPGDPPRRGPRVHGHLRPPPARPRRVAGRVAGRGPAPGTIVLLMAVENAPAIAAGPGRRRPAGGHTGRR